MRFLTLSAALLGYCAIATDCHALMYVVEGNEHQPEANYTRWSGLIDVVNLPSRQRLVWVNGNEHLYYQGDTDALNQALEEFAQISVKSHCVVLRPGPLTHKSESGPQKQFDWQLHVVDGIARAVVEHRKMQAVWDMDPVLTIYVSDRLSLDSIKFPEGIEVQQLADLRKRFSDAKDSGNSHTQEQATSLLKQIDEDPVREKIGDSAYQALITEITTHIQTIKSRQPKQ
jgi:hypothetical protein